MLLFGSYVVILLIVSENQVLKKTGVHEKKIIESTDFRQQNLKIWYKFESVCDL